MSLFQVETVECPGCGHPMEVCASDSVNADRRPDQRAAILDGSFQRVRCPECDEETRIDPVLTYLEISRNLWVLVLPHEALEDWRTLERQARASFELAFGSRAPRAAREIGERLDVRVTFGWPALSEKILAAEHGIDDRILELLKCRLFRSMPTLVLSDTAELRLMGTDGDTLALGLWDTTGERLIESMEVPRVLYDEILSDSEPWATLHASLTTGPFVDVHALLVAEEA